MDKVIKIDYNEYETLRADHEVLVQALKERKVVQMLEGDQAYRNHYNTRRALNQTYYIVDELEILANANEEIIRLVEHLNIQAVDIATKDNYIKALESKVRKLESKLPWWRKNK